METGKVTKDAQAFHSAVKTSLGDIGLELHHDQGKREGHHTWNEHISEFPCSHNTA